jgi:hypothetical protein
MNHTNRNQIQFIVALFLTILLLSACSSSPLAPSATTTPSPIPATAVPTTSPTPTAAPAKAVLVAPPEAGSAQIEAARKTLQELTGNSALVLDERPALQPNELKPEMKIIVLLVPPANLKDLLSAAPQTQFLTFSGSDLADVPNLSVIRYAPEHQAFIAGYLTTLAANDWRSAGLFPSDGPLGSRIEEVFRNGSHYLCGNCTPLNPPYVSFPVTASKPAASPPAEWQSSAEQLKQNVIVAYYVAPEAASNELLGWVVQQQGMIFGGQTPPDSFKANWAATIRIDSLAVLRDLWPSLVEGKGGQKKAANLQITDVNNELLSPGRKIRAEQVYQNLVDGLIDPFSPPLQ